MSMWYADLYGDLPFVTREGDAANFWCPPESTGDAGEDFIAGVALADRTLRALEKHPSLHHALQARIVAAILSNEITQVELGYLTRLSEHNCLLARASPSMQRH